MKLKIQDIKESQRGRNLASSRNHSNKETSVTLVMRVNIATIVALSMLVTKTGKQPRRVK